MTALQRLGAWLDRAEEIFIAAALGLMTILTFTQVVLRYLFQSGIVWSLEATTYIFGWLVVVGMAYGVRTRAHIAADVLTRSLGPRAQQIVAGTALVLCLAYCGLMIYASTIFVVGLVELGHDAQDIALPRWLLVSVLPVGFSLLAVRLVQAGRAYFMPESSAVAKRDSE